jgi:predicted transposase/invertase (TIGR01784 family)
VRIFAEPLINVVSTAERKGIIKGRKEGREEGRKEGERQAKINYAKAMKADGMPCDLIAKYTGLSLKDIANL